MLLSTVCCSFGQLHVQHSFATALGLGPRLGEAGLLTPQKLNQLLELVSSCPLTWPVQGFQRHVDSQAPDGEGDPRTNQVWHLGDPAIRYMLCTRINGRNPRFLDHLERNIEEEQWEELASDCSLR